MAAAVLSPELNLVSLQQPGIADSIEQEARGETTSFLAPSLTGKFASCFEECGQKKMDTFGSDLKLSC